MFEVGKSYNVVWLENGENYEGKSGTYENSIVYECGEVDGPLVKFLGPDYSKPSRLDELLGDVDRDRPRDEVIINTAGLFFVRAELVHEKEDEE